MLTTTQGRFIVPPTYVDLLRHRAASIPEDIAYTYLLDGETDEQNITYSQLDKKAKAIGAWLEAKGMTGKCVLLLYPAGLEFITAFFGCLYAGVIAVPLYPPRRNRSMIRVQAVVNDSKAVAALTTKSVLERVKPLIGETPQLESLAWLATDNIPEGLDTRWEMPDLSSDTLAFLQYTSGSTGAPKGVMLSHGNLLHNTALIEYAFEHPRHGGGVYWLPAYHDMGLIGGVLEPIYTARPNVIMSPMNFLQRPLRWLQAITRYRATCSGGPNFAYDLCVRKITDDQLVGLDLSSWELAFNGAEPVRAETLQMFAEKFAPCGFRKEALYPCFGMAETTLIITGGKKFNPPVIRMFDSEQLATGTAVECEADTNGETSRPLVGSGQQLPDMEVKIIDPDQLVPCEDGEIGEIWVSGPSVAQGYLDRSETTEATFHAKISGDKSETSYLRTGDLGFLLDGELFVTGRVKDMIIVRGVNHYPHDIERTVQQASDRLRGDAGGAFSVEGTGPTKVYIVQEVQRTKSADFEEIFDAIVKAVALEHEVVFEDIILIKASSIPKTSSGKIQRHACRRDFFEGNLNIIKQWSVWKTEQSDGEQEELSLEELKATAREERARANDEAFRVSNKMLNKNNEIDICDGRALTSGARIAQHGATSSAEAFIKPADKPLSPTARDRITQIVIQEIRKVAGDRADGLTLDTPIVETGMDSLERMEILASIEDVFGGRFPEDLLPDLETTNLLVDAVGKHFGSEPRLVVSAAAEGAEKQPPREIGEEDYVISQFTEVRMLNRQKESFAALGIHNPFFASYEGPVGSTTLLDGKELVNFGTYNYLGYAVHPEVLQAAKDAVDKYGTSAGASPLVAGKRVLHDELVQTLCKFLGTEDAVTFVSGHATNESVLGHLMRPGDLILHDALAHNSLIQGAIMSGAKRRPFKHGDFNDADEILTKYRHEYRRVVIVLEGTYSMDGDIPNLPEFVKLRKKHKTLLYVDEAHSLGVLGETGRGIGEHFGVDPKDVDVWMSSLGKTLAGCGGYIAGSYDLCEYLRYTTPAQVFSIGLSPPVAAATKKALELMMLDNSLVIQLRKNCKLLLDLLRDAGFDVGNAMGTAVVPVIFGNSALTLHISNAMKERGYSIMPILHPAVEEAKARLRFFVCALHTEEQIRKTVAALVEEYEKVREVYEKTDEA